MSTPGTKIVNGFRRGSIGLILVSTVALAAITGAQTNQPVSSSAPATANAHTNGISTNEDSDPLRSERVRSACIEGRRFICGRVVEVTKDGYVVESGYTELMRDPLDKKWVVPGNVQAKPEPHAIEGKMPGNPAYGLVFLTDTPRRPAPKKYDYVLLMGFPAGSYEYAPVPPVTRTIRKFAGSLEMAVALSLQAGEK